MDNNDIVMYEEFFSDNAKQKNKKYFIQVFFRNPVSHSLDWFIVGENGEDVLGEESAKLFDDINQAEYWMVTEGAHIKKDENFFKYEVKQSIYA